MAASTISQSVPLSQDSGAVRTVSLRAPVRFTTISSSAERHRFTWSKIGASNRIKLGLPRPNPAGLGLEHLPPIGVGSDSGGIGKTCLRKGIRVLALRLSRISFFMLAALRNPSASMIRIMVTGSHLMERES